MKEEIDFKNITQVARNTMENIAENAQIVNYSNSKCISDRIISNLTMIN